MFPYDHLLKIIAGQIPSYKIGTEDEKLLWFSSISFPLGEGHVLAVPKTETDKFFRPGWSLPGKMLVFAKPLHAIEKAFDCNRCGISVVGLEIPHAHLHLLPINDADDLNFTKAPKWVPRNWSVCRRRFWKLFIAAIDHQPEAHPMNRFKCDGRIGFKCLPVW